jgi:hypothetical protein
MAEINLKKLTASASSEIEVFFNSNLEGEADATIPLNVNLTDGVNPVTPTSVALTGNDLDIEIPPYDLDLTDRFGNVFSTVNIQGNSNVDLRTLTPYDWADLYINKLTNPPTGAQLTATIQFFDDIIALGGFSGAYNLGLCIGGNATDHAVNARYPFDTPSSFNTVFVGSPTHNANGVTTNGTSQLIRTRVAPSILPNESKQITVYLRNTLSALAAGAIEFGSGSLNSSVLGAFASYGLFAATSNFIATENTRTSYSTSAAQTNGMKSLKRLSGSTKYTRNGTTLSSNVGAINGNNGLEICIGGVLNGGDFNSAGTAFTPLEVCFWRIGDALTDLQETNLYTAVQALQTAFSRQV